MGMQTLKIKVITGRVFEVLVSKLELDTFIKNMGVRYQARWVSTGEFTINIDHIVYYWVE